MKTENHLPIQAKPYCKSKADEAQVIKELQQLMEAGLLKPSNSPCASPLLLIKKDDGSHCVVMDYHRLNTITHQDNYLLPQIDDYLWLLADSTYFSEMDLASGYWQIELSPED